MHRAPLGAEPLEPRYALTAVIAVGDHVLLAGEPNQTVEIRVSGDRAVQGLEFFLQVADGGPSVGGAVAGPVISDADVFGPPHRPENPATVFSGNNTGEASVGPWGPHFWQSGTTTASGTALADGLLATVVFDARGLSADDPNNPFDLKMADTLMGDSSFADGLPVTILNGRLILKPLPVAVIAEPVSVPAGGTVTLSGLASHAWDAADTIVAYEWDLDGDGIFGESGPAAGRGDETGPSPLFSATDLNADSTWTVALRVKDNNHAANPLFVSQVVETTVSVAAGARPHPWQNPVHPCDVTDEGSITPLDALVAINEINKNGIRELPVPPQPPQEPPPCYDVSGDDWLTAHDVLLVINYLNLHGAGPVPIPVAPSAASPIIPDSLADRVWAEGESLPDPVPRNETGHTPQCVAPWPANAEAESLLSGRDARPHRGSARWEPFDDLLTLLAERLPDGRPHGGD
jgi:hypothetical protein